MSDKLKLQQGKIYFISFGPNTQLVVRYKESDACNHKFYDHLHYWNGSETFHHGHSRNYCVQSGIQELREATLPEKHTLIRFELENNCI